MIADLLREAASSGLQGFTLYRAQDGRWQAATTRDRLGYQIHIADDPDAAAFGAVPFPSAGVGAPHISDRTYWIGERLANAGLPATERQRPDGGQILRLSEPERLGLGSDATSRLADPDDDDDRFQGRAFETILGEGRRNEGDAAGRSGSSLATGVVDTNGRDAGAEWEQRQQQGDGSLALRSDRTGPTNGFWRDPDWLFCRDGKWRPVEPGTFPLAHGAPTRVGRLRGYGNAINAEAATSFIEAYLETKAIDADRHIRLTALSDFTTNIDQQEDIFG